MNEHLQQIILIVQLNNKVNYFIQNRIKNKKECLCPTTFVIPMVNNTKNYPGHDLTLS